MHYKALEDEKGTFKPCFKGTALHLHTPTSHPSAVKTTIWLFLVASGLFHILK